MSNQVERDKLPAILFVDDELEGGFKIFEFPPLQVLIVGRVTDDQGWLRFAEKLEEIGLPLYEGSPVLSKADDIRESLSKQVTGVFDYNIEPDARPIDQILVLPASYEFRGLDNKMSAICVWNLAEEFDPDNPDKHIDIVYRHGPHGIAESALYRYGLMHLRASLISRSTSSATAAVLARNFSHIIGSHVISSPEFVERLLPAVWTFKEALSELLKMRDGSDADWREWGCTFSEIVAHAQREANRRDIWSRYGAIKSFHAYLQGRFDFIARAVERQADRPEPVFWVADVLEGFFQQSAFLATLSDDIGLGLEKIRVVLHLPVPNEAGGSLGQAQKHFLGSWKDNQNGKRTSWLHRLSWSECDEHGHVCGGESLLRPSDLATLVGMPGGMISAHALYALLENVMRNSAKYGTNRRIGAEGAGETGLRPYFLHLSLAEKNGAGENKDPECYELRVWDTYSGVGDRKKEVSIDGNPMLAYDVHWAVHKSLDTELLGEGGELNREALGFQEMKICARNLWADPSGEELDQEAREYLHLANVDDSADWQLPEGADPASDPTCHKRLTFCLDIAKPVLLATVSNRSLAEMKTGEGSGTKRPRFLSPYISEYGWDDESAKKLSASGAHIVVLDGSTQGKAGQAVKVLETHHTALPYRMLILCNEETSEAGEPREEYLRGKLQKHDSIPHLRVQCLTNPELWKKLFGQPEPLSREAQKDVPNEMADSKVARLVDEEKLIIECYEAWLKAWKPIDEEKGRRWHLWIGFERGNKHIERTWGSNLKAFKSDLIRIGVRAFESDGNEGAVNGEFFSSAPDGIGGEDIKGAGNDRAYWESDVREAHCNKRILVFDNHGKCFPESSRVTDTKNGGFADPRGWCRFYQSFSSDNIDLYRQLEHPPSSNFGFAWFIHSLVESCLTEVAVVDERLVSAIVTGASSGSAASPDVFGHRLREHQRAGIWPVFTVKQIDDKDKEKTVRGFYSTDQKKVAIEAVTGSPTKKAELEKEKDVGRTKEIESEIELCVTEAENLFKDEGIYFGRDRQQLGLLTTTDKTEASKRLKFRVTKGPCQLGAQVKCTTKRQGRQDGETVSGCNDIAPDVIVIHEGTLDLIHGDEEVQWEGGANDNNEAARKAIRLEHIRRLWKIAPCIVRTSGRGRHARHLRGRVALYRIWRSQRRHPHVPQQILSGSRLAWHCRGSPAGSFELYLKSAS